MNRPLPATLRPDWSQFLPSDACAYRGPMLPFWFAVLFLVVITIRSGIHLFAPDGGAHSIATIDTSVAGGPNIVAVFGQWGAIQLVLALLLWVLLLRYRGLTPLVLLVFTLEPFARGLSGHLKPLVTVGTAPGAALNWVVVPVLASMLWLSLCPVRSASRN
ncbi:MAG: hypothetical protein U0Q11_19725 [Vicinamibacterales bacterium]